MNGMIISMIPWRFFVADTTILQANVAAYRNVGFYLQRQVASSVLDLGVLWILDVLVHRAQSEGGNQRERREVEVMSG